MSKRNLFILLSIFSSSVALAGEMPSASEPKPAVLLHHSKGFSLMRDNGKPVIIQRAFMDKELRGISKEKLDGLIKMGARLELNKMKNSDDYALRLKGGLNGGGIFGAVCGAALAKAAVSVVGHGSILLVSSAVGLFCPPAGAAVGIALESTCGAMIESASIAAGVAGGIALGAATGPV